MKAFVTGSTGFLGTTLIQQLVTQGWKVIAFHRKSSDLSELKKLKNVEYRIGDVTDKASILNALPEGVDAFFHTAGSVGFLAPELEHEQYQINVVGTRNAVEAALEKRVRRFIYTSTVLIYDYSSGQRVDENSPPNLKTKSNYIKTKYLGDLEVEKMIGQGLDAVYLHASAIFGAYDKATWSKMFREMERGLRLPGSPPGGASVCHMKKVTQAHIAAFEKGVTGEHYVLGGPDKSMMEIGGTIAKIIDKPAPKRVLPSWLFRIGGRIEYLFSRLIGREPMVTPSLADILCEHVYCDSTKSIETLGYSPSSLEEMLMDCYQWMVKEKLLTSTNGAVWTKVDKLAESRLAGTLVIYRHSILSSVLIGCKLHYSC